MERCQGCMHKESAWCHRYGLPAEEAREYCEE